MPPEAVPPVSSVEVVIFRNGTCEFVEMTMLLAPMPVVKMTVEVELAGALTGVCLLAEHIFVVPLLAKNIPAAFFR